MSDASNPHDWVDWQEESDHRRLTVDFAPNLYILRIQATKTISTTIGQSVSDLLGYGIDELQSDSNLRFNIIHPSDRDRVQAAFRRLLDGEPMAEVYRIFGSDGQVRWVRETAAAQKGPGGDVNRIIGFISDAGAERPARKPSGGELLRAIQQSLLAHIAVIDRNGDIIAVNQAWERFARENGDPTLEHTGIGVNYLDVCRRAKGPYSEGAVEALDGLLGILDGSIDQFEMEYTCPSPTAPGWYIMRASPLQHPFGGAVVTHTDITARKSIQEALRESEEYYRTLVENVDAIIFRLDPETRPIMIAGRAERMAECNVSEAPEPPELWVEMVHPEDLENERSRYANVAASGQPSSAVVRIISCKGEVRWLRTHVSPRYDANGNLIYFDGVGLDVTDQMEAHRRETRYAARMAALADISQAFASSLDIGRILDSATKMTSDVLECACTVLTIDPESGRMRHSVIHSDDEAWSRALEQALREVAPTAEEAISGREIKPVIVPDATADRSPQVRDFARRTGVGSILAAPMLVEGRLFGIVVGGHRKEDPVFDDEDLWFLTEVASHASAALTNAALYRRQARIAENLQRSLIPVSVHVSGLEIATCYYPALGEAEVGGDFFDIIDFHDGTVGVVVGDVSGKGMEAAMHTAEAKYMLRGFALQSPDPGLVVSALNQALSVYLEEFTFVTLFYGLIDLTSGKLTYVNAGHEPALIIRPEEHGIRELLPSGPVIGVVGAQSYSSHIVESISGGLLFCYTDGVTDVPCDSERFGYDRLLETIAGAAVRRSNELMSHVIERVRDFGSGRQPDDQVILVIRLES